MRNAYINQHCFSLFDRYFVTALYLDWIVIGLDGKSAWWPKSACYRDLEWQICSADNLAIGPTSLRGHGLILIQLAGKTTITFSSNLLPLQASSTAEQANLLAGSSPHIV
jgi:hypothetical protein